jgi:hypothetical protein
LFPGTQNFDNVVVGDFNSDGVLDLLFANALSFSPDANVLISKPFVSLVPSPLAFSAQEVGAPTRPKT